ncbi:IS66 family transposase [Sulfuricurvum sp. IAE1]|uniref:IS66 family transposase n=1 Tax=Sulfuricurvum sp. IAE1 TaxID=2546102 RepID=UPI0010531515|nr:IS66 family transposase [Sulfuricurvum sp. IAE1]TDA68780.1 IS66 family transposase [Sulfuricurvum sp. IAE1]
MTDFTIDKAKELRQRLASRMVTDDDYGLMMELIDSYVLLKTAFKEKNGTITRLLRMIFGAPTEKAQNVLPDKPRKPEIPRDKPKGHGRNGASVYAGKKIVVPHSILKKGDACPGCEKGKLYPFLPGVTIRVTGNAPLDACVWEQEKFRCNLCGEIFTAKLPDEAGSEKYDPSAGAMIPILKYGSGLPFNRLEELQEGLGVPLPSSTQWDIVEKTADRIHPVYHELIRQAAQGDIIHNDDTTMKILSLVNDKERRKGIFTTGMLSFAGTRKIALFVTGHTHAGENITGLLRERHPDRAPPIQMCDALSRNTPKEFETILANCMAHARRNFVDITESFPEECRYVIEILGVVYKNNAEAKDMAPSERLIHHRLESGPFMEKLHEWITGQFEKKTVEPNSGLGKAFSYMLKHWEPLTLFLKVEGAPLDNNICEQALKRAILHRKNSLFYKTLHGAYIGDIFMSIIHTCRLSKVNPFDYLIALQKHSSEVFRNPQKWLPWNYKDGAPASL